jgi:uncharacterized membrane protein
MFNQHFFKVITMFIVMIMLGIALLFVSGEVEKSPTGKTQQSQLDAVQ